MKAHIPLHRSVKFKLLCGIAAVLIPLIGYLLYNNYYAKTVVRNQVSQSTQLLLDFSMRDVDSRLEEIDQYLYMLSAGDSDLLGLEISDDATDIRYFQAKFGLFKKITNDIANFELIDSLFVYSVVNHELIASKMPGETYRDREAMKLELDRLLQAQIQSGDPPHNSWLIAKLNGEYVLYRIVKSGGTYIGALTRAKRLITPLHSSDLWKMGSVLLVDEQFKPLSAQHIIAEEQIVLLDEEASGKEPYRLVGENEQYLQLSKKSDNGEFFLLVLLVEKKIMERLPMLHRITQAILIGYLLLFPLFILYINKEILRPIKRIVSAMQVIRKGNISGRISLYRTSFEFELMNETFNTMIAQIKDLKIHVYEEQINSQRAELMQLQLQINPHFFLNSLNIIFGLAQLKKYELIQEMSHSLVQYMRFMYQTKRELIALKEEIEHVNNYLRIQSLRFPDHLTFSLHSSASPLMEALVPPLSVQTFVENTIKHAAHSGNQIHVTVAVEQYDESDAARMKIVVSDSGPGFDPVILEKLHTGDVLTDEQGEHIGIWNVRRRLQLLFRERGKVVLYNREPHGAVAELHLPIFYSGYHYSGGEDDHVPFADRR